MLIILARDRLKTHWIFITLSCFVSVGKWLMEKWVCVCESQNRVWNRLPGYSWFSDSDPLWANKTPTSGELRPVRVDVFYQVAVMKDDQFRHFSVHFCRSVSETSAWSFRSSWQCPSMSQASHYDRQNREIWGRYQIHEETQAKTEALAECSDRKCLAGCSFKVPMLKSA